MRPRRAGLTLLELMVGLVILGLLLVALENGVQLGLRAWHADTRISANSEDLITTDRVLRQLLTGMEPGGGRTVLYLDGRKEVLSFTTMLPASAASPTRRVDARLLVDEKRRLVLRWTPHLHERALEPPPREQETSLLDAVEQVEFSYWREGAPAGWQTGWSEQGLPSLVRVRLIFPPGSARHWPDFIAAPLLEPAGG